MPHVLGLGTCRIFRPLRRLDAAGDLTLLHYAKTPRWWFTHTTAEARQYVDALEGKLDIPAGLRPLVCETTAELAPCLADPDSLEAADVAVVEVSTFKTLTVDGYRLNFQNAWTYARDAGVDPRAVLAGEPVDWPDHAQALAGLEVGRAGYEDVTRELLELRELLGIPLVTVDHLAATGSDGKPVPGRPAITAMLGRIEQEHGIAFHRTAPTIQAHGESTALQDVNHYAADFEQTAGEALWSTVRRALG